MPYVVNGKKIADILLAEEAKPLETEFELEDLIAFIGTLDNKIDFLNNLKKNRVATIQSEIDKFEQQKKTLKEVIILTLEKAKSKSLSFPGVGKVILKEKVGSWNIIDEVSLIDTLKKELSEDDYKKVVQTKEVLNKRDINNILDNWKLTGKLPPSVSKDPDTKSLSVIIDDKFDIDYNDSVESPSEDEWKLPETKLEEMDSMEI